MEYYHNDKAKIIDEIKAKGVETGYDITMEEIPSKIAEITEIDLQEKEIEITENGTTTVEPDEDHNGLTSVEITVNVPNPDYFGNEISGVYSPSEPQAPILTTIKKSPSFEIANNSCSGLFFGVRNLEEAPMLDTSNVTTFNRMFNACSKITSIPQYDTSKVTDFERAFGSCSALITIPLLDLSSATMVAYMCYNDNNIENLGGFKDLGKAYLTTASANYNNYTLTINSPKITHDSLMNVINNLYDIATAGVQTQKVIVGSANLEKLTAEEIAVATAKGWTISAS